MKTRLWMCLLVVGASVCRLSATTITWTNINGGNWNVPANWDPNQAPGPSDTALITTPGTYAVTLNVDATVSGLTLGAASGAQSLAAASHTLTLNGPGAVTPNGFLGLNASTVSGTGTLNNQGTVALTNSTIAATFVNQGLITPLGTSVLSGLFQNQPGGALQLFAISGVLASDLTVANGFTNGGTIVLSSTNGVITPALHLTSGTLVNAPGGQLNILAGSGGGRTLDAQLDNEGALTVGASFTLAKASANHLNNGTISLTSGSFLVSLSGGSPSFTNSGTINLGAGQFMTVAGGSFGYTGGSIDGPGTLELVNTTAGFVPNFNNAITGLGLNASTVNGPGIITNVSGQTLALTNSTINAGLVNQGLLTPFGSSFLGGPFQNQAGATLQVVAISGVLASDLTVTTGFTNNGTIVMSSSNGVITPSLHVTSGSLVNAPGAQINILAGTGGARTLDAQLDNQGSLSAATNFTLSRPSADHLNSGTINITGGICAVTLSGGNPSFTNSGNINLGAGVTMAVSGGSFGYAGGTIDGPGTLQLVSTSAGFAVDFSNAVTGLGLNGTILNGPGTITNAPGQTFALTNSTINAGFVNQGLLTPFGNSTLAGPFDNQAGGTLQLIPISGVLASDLTVAAGFTNNGIILMSSSDGVITPALHVSTGSLVNPVTGQIIVLAGSGGGRTLDAQLINQGTVSLGTDFVLNKASADHLNTGTINITGGNFAISLSGASPSFTNSGSINIGAGLFMTVSGGSFGYAGGSIGGPGTLELANAVAGFVPNFSNAVTGLGLIGSTLNGPGVITNLAGRTLGVTNSLINTRLINQGLLIPLGNDSFAGLFQNQGGAILRLMAVEGVLNSDLTISSGFTNNGLIELTSSNGVIAPSLHVTTGTLVNPAGGQINILAGSGGSRTLDAEVNNQGSLTVGADFTMNKASADHLNSGAIIITGGNFVLSQSGTSPSFTNSGTISIGAGLFMTVSGGSFGYTSGSIDGAGTLELVNTVAGFVPNFSNAITGLGLNGSTLNGPGIITNVAGRTLGVTNSAITAGLMNQGLLLPLGSDTFGGLFQNQGGAILRLMAMAGVLNSDLTISSGFTNNGLIELTSSNGVIAPALHVTTGTLVNPTGGQIDILPGSGGGRTLDAEVNNQGSLAVGTDFTMNKASADHLNSGAIIITGGNFVLSQSGASPTFTNSGTINIGVGQRLIASGGVFQNILPGIIEGNGTIDVTSTVFANAGNINPGTSPGLLTGLGNFPLLAPGNLNIELGGTTQGAQYDALNLSNSVTLGGNLVVKFVNGFGSTVSSNDTFTIVAAGSLSGTFGNAANGAQAYTTDGIGSFQVNYSPATKTVVLSAFQPILPVVAAFNAAPTNGPVPLAVNFNNLTTGSATNFNWSFGDGFGTNSFSPTHVYTNTGTFSVTLTASGPGGTNTTVKTNLITAAPAVCFPVVDNVNDSGPGSLRAAILCANSTPGPTAVTFNIPGAGVHTIHPLTPLPIIASGLVLDGYSQPGSVSNTLAGGDNALLTIELDCSAITDAVPALSIVGDRSAVRGLVINRAAAGDGVYLAGNSNRVEGCFIGTDAAGQNALTNGGFGVRVESNSFASLIGGASFAARNLISGNGVGIGMVGDGSVVQGNFIGTDATGTNKLGNAAAGIEIIKGSGNLVGGGAVGAGNVIAFNGGASPASGVALAANPASTNNVIRANSIFGHAGLGIDLLNTGSVLPNDPCDADTGANNNQNFPVIVGSTDTLTNTTITGFLNSTANTTFTLDFYANPGCNPSGNGEGKFYLGSTSLTTGAICSNSFVFTPANRVPPGLFITATATDPNGNTSEFSACSQLNQLPVAMCRNVTNPANANCQASVTPAAVDNGSLDADGIITNRTLSPPGPYPLGVTPVTLTVTDNRGASDSCTASITVLDQTPPSLACPANITRPADPGQCSASNVTYSAVASDNCGSVNVVFAPPSGSTFPKGTNLVRCIATDTAGNSNSCSFLVLVRDLELPAVTCPADIVRSVDPGQCSASNVTYTADVTDNCPGATVFFSPPSGSTFPKGTNQVLCIARDASANTNLCSFFVVVRDGQPPSLTCPANIVRATDPGQCSASNVTYSATVDESCSGGSVAFVPPSGSAFPKGTNTVTCTATDASGNSNSCSFLVIIQDQTPPTLVCPTDISVTTESNASSAVVTFPTPSFSDNCPGTTFSFDPPSGSSFPPGTNQARCTVTDAAGNTNSCAFNVAVNAGSSSSTNADLILTQSAPATALVGDELTFTLTVSNAGPQQATGIEVVDHLSTLVAFVAATNQFGTSTQAAGNVTCQIPSLDVGASASVTVTALALCPGRLCNFCAVHADQFDPILSNNNASACTVVTRPATGADISVTPMQVPGVAALGDEIAYHFRVRNNGPRNAKGITLTDVLPAALTFVSASGKSSCKHGVVTCSLGNLSVGDSVVETIVATAHATGMVCNAASVVSKSIDPVEENNSAAPCVEVSATPPEVHGLAVTKLIVPRLVVLNDQKPERTEMVTVRLQNCGPHTETIANLDELLTLTVESLGACPNLVPVLIEGRPQRRAPLALQARKSLYVFYKVTFSTNCINDPLHSEGAASPCHEDYRYRVVLHPDSSTHPDNNLSSRSVNPLLKHEADSHDRGWDNDAGSSRSDHAIGANVKTDVFVVPPVSRGGFRHDRH